MSTIPKLPADLDRMEEKRMPSRVKAEMEEARRILSRVIIQPAPVNEKEHKMNKPTEHAGLPVAGYLPQSAAKVDLVNANKGLEERCLRALDHLATLPDTDKRHLALARTHLETAWMWANRAVFRPARVPLPGDP